MSPDLSKTTLSPDRRREVERLYRSALALSEEKRAPYLRDACGADADLRREVDGLLSNDELAREFLERTAPAPLTFEETIPALEATRRALRLDASNTWASLVMGWAYEQLGQYRESIAAMEKFDDSSLRTAAIAHVFAASDNRPAAETLLSELLEKAKKEYVSAYDIAVVYAGLGETDRAFDSLNKAYEEESGFLPYLSLDPRIKPLRADRRYQDLLRRMGLTQSI